MNLQNMTVGTLALALLLSACTKDDNEDQGNSTAYDISILSPNSDDKHLGDTLTIEVSFTEKHTGIVHHINIAIKNRDTGVIVYSKPNVAHVHEESGHLVFADNFILSEMNGVSAHTDWVLTAKVWGHEEGVAEEMHELEFHVHP